MPSNIRYWWNFGSLLGATLIIQIIRGLFLRIYFENSIREAFNRISQIERNINIGWMIRSIHANGASIFFIFIYLHIGRGLYFQSYNLSKVWLTGVSILIMLFITAFIGYVLPWGQIRFWGATVITNLLTSIPYIGNQLVTWLWGNFRIRKATLIRFFSLHFLFPFIIRALSIIHIIFLHKIRSNNPLGSNSLIDKIPFHPFFSWKDLLGVLFCINIFIILVIIKPFFLIDPDNFIPANPLVTPPHIQPEWYFLFAYAILRTIPNKLGGVLALLFSILVLIYLPFLLSLISIKQNNFIFKPIFKTIFYTWISNFLFLTTIGAIPIEDPFITLSKLSRNIYFYYYFLYF